MSTPDQVLAQAKRCQLLIGSFTASSRSCSCPNSEDCPLSEVQRQLLRNHSAVVEAQRLNREEYDAIRDESK